MKKFFNHYTISSSLSYHPGQKRDAKSYHYVLNACSCKRNQADTFSWRIKKLFEKKTWIDSTSDINKNINKKYVYQNLFNIKKYSGHSHWIKMHYVYNF